MSFSQIIPHSPSPTESKRLFYISVSLLLSRIQGGMTQRDGTGSDVGRGLRMGNTCIPVADSC